jgi:hypothetical protein
LQTASFDKIERINSEKKVLVDREQKRLRQASTNHARVNGGAGPHFEDDIMSSDD